MLRTALLASVLVLGLAAQASAEIVRFKTTMTVRPGSPVEDHPWLGPRRGAARHRHEDADLQGQLERAGPARPPWRTSTVRPPSGENGPCPHPARQHPVEPDHRQGATDRRAGQGFHGRQGLCQRPHRRQSGR